MDRSFEAMEQSTGSADVVVRDRGSPVTIVERQQELEPLLSSHLPENDSTMANTTNTTTTTDSTMEETMEQSFEEEEEEEEDAVVVVARGRGDEDRLESLLSRSRSSRSWSSDSSTMDPPPLEETMMDPEETMEDEPLPVVARRRGKPLSDVERRQVLESLLSRSNGKKLQHGAIAAVAKEHHLTRKSVTDLWQRGLESVKNGAGFMDVSNNKSNCGRKKKDYSDEMAAMKDVSHTKRRTIRSTAAAVGIPKSTFHGRKKEGIIRVHSSSAKPLLTDDNKRHRVDFCLQRINPERDLFESMMNTVHIDEKWFFLGQATNKVYLAPGEEDPYRAWKSKRFIPKVMFLSAVARPRWDTTRNCLFDGKLGIWPFVIKVPAQRNSRNRERGTMVTKPINVDSKVYREYIINKVLPAIEEKWPRCHRSMAIKLQHDNAKPHIKNNDPAFMEAVANMELDLELIQQPPNSPDLNVLDLGYFNAIQALQQQQRQDNIDDLIKAVEDSFVALDKKCLNKVFLTLQKVMELVILNDGRNDYKLPHLRKAALERQGQLPVSISVTDELKQKIESIAAARAAVAGDHIADV